MNQEQNNLNPNNYNTQGNNRVPDNQPLNNQSFNTTYDQSVAPNTNFNQTTINQQSINTQSQTMNNFENNNTSFNGQPLNNQNNNTIYPNNNLYLNSNQINNNNYQTANTMSQESINSQNSNEKNKNKTIIIIAIALVIVIAVIIGTLLIGKDGNKNSGNNFINNSNNVSSSDEIVQIYIDGYKGSEYNAVVALSKNNKLYAIGKNYSNGWGGQDDLKKVTLLADNVNSFDDMGNFYIDNTGNINISGVDIKGGVHEKYENIGGNIKKISGHWAGLLAVDKDGNLYSYGMAKYNGFGVKYDELTKIENINNVTDVYLDILLAYYINSANELYAKCTFCSGNFEKILDDVKTANGNAIQTQDNKIYDISYYSDESKVVASVQEEAVSIINTSSGIYYQSEDNNIWHIDEHQRKLSSVSYSHHYPKDVKQMIYMKEVCDLSFCSGIKYIYLNNSNKLNLYEVKYDGNYSSVSDENTETFNYTIDNMEKIYNFISS